MIIQNTFPMNQPAGPGLRPASPDPGGAATAFRAPVTPPQPAPIPAGSVQADAAKLKDAVAAINRAMQQSNRKLEFSVDTDSQRTVVRMVDTSTGELIRQFPSETALAISRGIEQFQQGLLLTHKA